MPTDDPSGIDSTSVTPWLLAHVPGSEAPFAFDQIAGGASNLTFRVTDGHGRKVVLRRPPMGHVLASAHDMGREFRIIDALWPTDVPVPRPFGLCADEAVNGADFYVMDFVEGSIVFDLADGNAVDRALRPIMTDSLVDTLAVLHTVDPDDVGLGDLGRKADYCGRQLRRWKRQVDEGSDRDLPLVTELHDRMAATMPGQQGAGIVHGDFRLDNCMMSHDGSVAAVLDWELCTLGDVLADLAGMVMWWGDETGVGRLSETPTLAEGFGDASHVIERYGETSERDLSDLPWYVAFQYWRLACISEGVRVRFAAGVMGETDRETDEYGDSITYLLERSKAVLDADTLD
ncbi:MAG: phosphotransferase family protein [Actinomycetia bacterium]|nr:phosphotransferase family protein [Actinomycetes bacterium]